MATQSGSAGALDGVRILDLTTEMGQYAGKLLADLGADVIKVEPPGGDAARGVGPFAGDRVSRETSLSWWYFNANKRSVTCNLDEHDGRWLFGKLVEGADCLLESFDDGYLDERGFGYEALRERQPKMIYVSIRGFGASGPHAGWKASDIIGLASSGVLTLSGDPADPPQTLGGQQGYITASLAAAQGATLAIFQQERQGQGQHVDVSMQEALSIAQETAMPQWDFQQTSRERVGASARLPGLGTYKTKDGYLFAMVGAPAGASWSVLLEWMEEEGAIDEMSEEIADGLRSLDWQTLAAALADPAKTAELQKLFPVAEQTLAKFMAERETLALYEAGQSRRLLFGLVSTPKDLVENPQLRARDWFLELERDGQTIDFPGPPYRLSETPVTFRRPPPTIGEHNQEVWVDEVGIPADDVTLFSSEGAI